MVQEILYILIVISTEHEVRENSDCGDLIEIFSKAKVMKLILFKFL